MANLSLHGIDKAFGTTKVLRSIDLEIPDKELVVFVGPSGCGKTTLLRIIAGLEEPTAGELKIDNKDVLNAHPLERGVAMVFQSYALYPHLSVFENIAFPLRVAKDDEETIKAKVAEAANILQLTDRLNFKPGQLSGGQRQRVAIGRAIVRKPKVFLFDEPLSNLDAALRGEMRVELARLHQQLATTMIYVTHDQIEAMTMSDRIVVLSDGVLMQQGPPLELFHRPTNKFVAGFIGHPTMNFLSGTCEEVLDNKVTVNIPAINSKITIPVTAMNLKQGDKVEVGIRPDDVVINAEIPTQIKLNIQVLERLGNDSVAYGQIDDSERFCAVIPGDVDAGIGDTINLGLRPASCHLFNTDGEASRRLEVPSILNKIKQN